MKSKPKTISNKCSGCGGKRDEHRSTYCTNCISKGSKKITKSKVAKTPMKDLYKGSKK